VFCVVTKFWFCILRFEYSSFIFSFLLP
jgi:hypothetical protein